MPRKIKSLRREVKLKRIKLRLSLKKKKRFSFHKPSIAQCVMPISCL